MKLNIHILFDELKDLAPIINTKKDIDCSLSKIRLFSPQIDQFETDCIYMLDPLFIKDHAHRLANIDLISVGVMDLSKEDLADLSVIMLYDECDKNFLFNRIQDIFEKYERWDYNLMRSIAIDAPLQTIADLAATMLLNPFALLDITLKRILIGGEVPQNYKGSVWEIVMENEYTPSETFSLTQDDLYFFLTYNKKPYFVTGPPFQYAHLLANIYIENKLFAMIATTDINAPFSQGQLSLLQHIREVMELAIASSVEFKGSTETVVYYLEKLLKDFPVDEKIIIYHLNQRHWTIQDKFCIYTITNPDGKELSDSQAKFCLFRIKKLREDVILFCYENSIIVITRDSRNNENVQYQKNLNDLISKLGLHCGCSNVFDRFVDLKYYYIQSKAALYEGEKENTNQNIWNFDDYYFSHLIDSLDHSTSLKSMCHPQILRLHEFDHLNGTDFVQCLRIYLFNGCNIAQTGKELFMHRNTLTYRLEKIADIIEMDVRQLAEDARMQLWFSCRLTSVL